MNSLEMYRYYDGFYTGTSDQPDTLSFFLKKEDKSSLFINHAEHSANLIGKLIPIAGSLTGIVRISNAVKEIFKSISSKDQLGSGELWNAFKNLFRGIAETLPFSGIFLLVFDAVRNTISIHSSVVKQTQGQNNIAGIALDGKVIVTIDLTDLKSYIKKIHSLSDNPSDNQCLTNFKKGCLMYLKELEKNGSQLSMTQIFKILQPRIHDRAKIND